MVSVALDYITQSIRQRRLKDILEKSIQGMSYPEIYQKCRTHLLTQGEKSLEAKYVNCRYRTADGLSCAVGCLIFEELYDPDIEGLTVSKSWGTGVVTNWALLRDLQNVHDTFFPEDWATELDALADAWLVHYGIDLQRELT
jgi:hypothetical protein